MQTDTMTAEIQTPREPGRARALLSTRDFQLIRAALASHAKATEDPAELKAISSLYHRLGAYS